MVRGWWRVVSDCSVATNVYAGSGAKAVVRDGHERCDGQDVPRTKRLGLREGSRQLLRTQGKLYYIAMTTLFVISPA